jgi:hypothetical protein
VAHQICFHKEIAAPHAEYFQIVKQNDTERASGAKI